MLHRSLGILSILLLFQVVVLPGGLQVSLRALRQLSYSEFADSAWAGARFRALSTDAWSFSWEGIRELLGFSCQRRVLWGFLSCASQTVWHLWLAQTTYLFAATARWVSPHSGQEVE